MYEFYRERRRKLGLWLVAFLLFASLVPAAGPAKVANASGHTDDFDTTTLDSAWSWVRQDSANWSLSERSGYMRIKTQNQDLYASSNNTENILLRTPPTSDWTMETKLDFSPTTAYQMAGLVVYKDDDNYFRLVKFYNGPDTQVSFDKEIGGSFDFHPSSLSGSGPIYFRATKAGNTYTGSYSTDGTTFTQIYQYTNVDLGSGLKIGLITQSASGANGDFDWFDVQGTSSPTPTPTPPPTGFNDQFSQATLDSAWSWVRQDSSNWSLSARSGFMRINTQGQDLYGGSNNTENILLKTPSTSDWTIKTKVEFNPNTTYQMAGLIVYKDDDNYFRMVDYYNGPGDNNISFDKEIGGSFEFHPTDLPAQSGTVYLKVVKSGNTYTGCFSLDDVTYTRVYQYTGVNLGSGVKVGLLVQSTAGVSADFDWFNENSSTTSPSPTPTTTPSPTPTPTPPVTPTPTPTPTATPTPTPTPPPGTHTDEFNSTTLNSAWSWVREDAPNWSLSERTGYMRIKVQDQDLYGNYNSTENVLLRTPPSGDWTMRTKLDFNPNGGNQMAGLVVYKDDDNYMRLVEYYNGPGDFNVSFDKEVAQQFEFRPADTGNGTTIYLKLTKVGTTYRAYYSPDDRVYTFIYEYENPAIGTPIKVGLIGQNYGGVNADFDWFDIGTVVPDPIITVTSPAYRADVNGTTTISFNAPGLQTVTATSWHKPDTAHPAAQGYESTIATVTVSGGTGSFSFPANDYPHGPITVVLKGVGADPLVTDICYLQLFNTGGVAWNQGIPSAPSQTSGMSVVFQDDFTGSLSISRTGQGTTYMSQKPDFQQFGMAAFEDYDSPHNPFAIKDSNYLRIRTQKAPAGYVDPMGWGRTYTSGILSAGHADGTATGAATLGYFEARVAFPAGHVNWGAFWIMSQLGITGHNTYGTAEIDIFEGYGVYPDGPDYVHQVMHDWAPPGQTDVVHNDHMTKYSDFGINANLSQAFHVYAAKVTNTDTIFYIDNVEVWRTTTTARAKTAMYFILNNGISHYWPIDLARYNYGADMYVDYVRVFQ